MLAGTIAAVEAAAVREVASERMSARAEVVAVAGSCGESSAVAVNAAAVAASRVRGNVVLVDLSGEQFVPLVVSSFHPNVADLGGGGSLSGAHLDRVLVRSAFGFDVVLGPELASSVVPAARWVEVLEALRGTHDLVICAAGDPAARSEGEVAALAGVFDCVLVTSQGSGGSFSDALVAANRFASATRTRLVCLLPAAGAVPAVGPAGSRCDGGDGCEGLPVADVPVLGVVQTTGVWRRAFNAATPVTAFEGATEADELAHLLFGVLGDRRLLRGDACRSQGRRREVVGLVQRALATFRLDRC